MNRICSFATGWSTSAHRGRETCSGAEELTEHGGQVARAHPVQVHERGRFEHLRALAAPRGDDRAREFLTFPLCSSIRLKFTRRASISIDPARS
jgi:hypothetical protein